MKNLLGVLVCFVFTFQISAADFKIGDRVQCNWKGGGTFYNGKITSLKGNKAHISYDDGDQEDTTLNMCKKGDSGSSSNSSGNCHFNGKQLWGKVQFVTSFPDIKVQVVNSFPDLKVQMVNSFPDSCGKWQETSSFPDLKVQIVESFPDIKIQYVNSFPGK